MASKLFLASIIAIIVVALYVGVQNITLTNEYNSLTSQYSNLTTRYNGLTNQYDSLSSKYSMLSANFSYQSQQLNASEREYDHLMRNYTRTNIIYRAPAANQSVSIWGINTTIRAHSWTAWNLLDTFDNHIAIDSNSSSSFMIVSDLDFANFRFGQPYEPWISYSGSQFRYEATVTEGCGFYIVLIQNPSNHTVLISPHVTATLATTPFLTGACSLP